MRLHAQAARPYLCSAADRSWPSREPLPASILPGGVAVDGAARRGRAAG